GPRHPDSARLRLAARAPPPATFLWRPAGRARALVSPPPRLPPRLARPQRRLLQGREAVQRPDREHCGIAQPNQQVRAPVSVEVARTDDLALRLRRLRLEPPCCGPRGGAPEGRG